MSNLSIRCCPTNTLRAEACPRPQRSSASMSCSWLFLGGLLSSRARLRFTNWRTACDTRLLPVDDFSANAKQCLIRLSQPRAPLQTFGTTTRELLSLRQWLFSEGCTHVALESAGVYWKPVYAILEGSISDRGGQHATRQESSRP